MARLNICPVDPDAILREALAQIDGEVPVGDALRGPNGRTPGLSDVMQTTTVARPILLDLIAHAADGVLQLGAWAIKDQDPSVPLLATAIPAGSLSAVRLLGCFTAHTSAGRAVMRYLKKTLKVPVVGTSGMIYASDFGSDGFHNNGMVLEVGDLPTGITPLTISDHQIAQGFARFPRAAIQELGTVLRAETRAEAEATWSRYPARWKLQLAAPFHPTLDALLSSTASDVRTAPGLLALPDGELLYPAPEASGRFYRVSLLFGGRLLRVYPQSHPAGVLLQYRGLLI